MHRAKKKTEVVVAKEKKAQLVRICHHEGCNNVLPKMRKSYCSRDCRNLCMSTVTQASVEVISKYKPEYATTVFAEYIAECKKANEPNLVPTQSSYLVLQDAMIPTIDGYAEKINVDPKTLDNWSLKHREFALVMDRLLRIQKEVLINNGLSRRYDSGMAKMLLNINHGMVERTAVDNTHKFIGMVKVIYEAADRGDKK